MYVELHAHSAFSFLDGASTPLELAAAAASHGYPAFALTDHDGVWGSMEFAHACRGFGIRPITGAELTVRCGPAGPDPDLVPPSLAFGEGRSPKSAPPTGRDVEAGAQAESAAEAEPVRQPRFEVRFRTFNERADRVAARLRALQEQRSHPAGPSAVAARRRGDG